ncbi:hypothetical protein [Herbaspirillum huttiense]|uniref:hypothetical protein n=1 Tax=Herbaspirillum huttiense TaxID=863372 RepID=UPI0039AFC12E
MQTRKIINTAFVSLAAASIGLSSGVFAQGKSGESSGEITDPVKIAKVLGSVPTVKGSLADRLTEAGMRPVYIKVSRLSRDDLADFPARFRLKPGDAMIAIATKGFVDGVGRVQGCDLWSSPTLLKGGSTYYPYDKTSNWLLTGQCIAP